MKSCVKCKSTKPLCDFHKDRSKRDGRATVCKKCRSDYIAEYYQKNAERLKQVSRDWYAANKERAKARARQYYLDNIEAFREYRKAQYWNNRDAAIRAACDYLLERQKRDPIFRLELRCRKRVWAAFFESGYSKKTKTFKMIGLNKRDLAQYIESKFEDGMSWENYGEWHIDHIIPFKAASTPEQIEALCHYTNLQPLWAEENIKKSASYCQNEAKEYFKRMGV